VKRLALIVTGLLALVLAACAPTPTVETNVLPTLISVSVPQSGNGPVVLQGRYFGNGQAGASDADSYVIVGADINGDGGVRVTANSWSASRIEITVPEGAGAGFIYVVVNGVRSNGLPANLP